MRTVFRRNLGMRGRLMAAAALSTLMLAAPMSANAQTGNVVVEGNQRIEAATILSYLNLGDSGAVSAESVNAASKRLFETGLFSDVQIMQRGGQVVVVVQENPVVNQVAFEGNNRIKDEQLAGIVQSAERRVFTRARAEQDAEAILEAYRRSGRYAAAVTPKIIELDQNRVDLVFEVDEGPQTDVSSIPFVGNTAFSDSRLRSAIATSESGWWKIFSTTDSYDPDRLEYDKELLARYYRARGYADVQVRSAVAELSPDRSGFYLTFTVDEGPYYTFGNIDVASSAPGVDPEALRSAARTPVTTTRSTSPTSTCTPGSLPPRTSRTGCPPRSTT